MTKSSRLDKKKQKKHETSQANNADRHVLYQKSVQDTDVELTLMVEKYKAIRGKDPLSFREDFCGTGLLSVDWCKSLDSRTAQGIDLCAETLAWGKQHNLEPAGEQVASRVELKLADVLEVSEPKVDVTCALNFSYSIFKTRDALCQYFEAARKGLKDDGIFMLDIFGGPESIDTSEEDREVDDETFEFVWDQDKYNPVTNEILCHIHFKFDDGSRIEKAFTYDWRLWSIVELNELLLEAGFSKTHVYWEEYVDDDDDDEYLEGTGNYIEVSEVEQQESWVSYIFAEA
ncbi:MAG: class I SAM-dependent methyltransferase [Gammaproteobacteria bacterium]|nr:class I SAM-dependent methyltransferase [Gammaproteobacteria bacterium]